MQQDNETKGSSKQPSRRQTKRKELAHLWHFESMDRVNRALQGTSNLEQVMKDVLDILLSVFECDRAWLVYPCDPDSLTWQVPMERTRPEYPGVLPIGVELPLDPVGAEIYRLLRKSDGPVKFGAGEEYPVPMEMATAFNVQSFIAMAFYPKVGKPWSLGLHQCSYARVWTLEEERLFQEVGRRLSDALSSLLAFRNLQESEKQIKQLIDASPVAMVVSSGTEERVEWVNNKFIELFGYTAEDMPDVEHWWPLAYPDDRYREEIKAQWEANVEQAIQKKNQIKPIEATVRCKDGSYRHVEFRLSSIGEKHIVTFVDLTEHKRMEEALSASEAELRTLINAMTDIIFVGNSEGRYLKIVDTSPSLLYKPSKELLGKTLHEVFPKDLADFFLNHLRQALNTQKSVNFEYSLPIGDKKLWFYATVSPMTDDKILMVARDITDRKQAEDALRESEERYRQLINLSPDGISIHSQGYILFVNPAMTRMSGATSADQMLGKSVLDFVHPDFRELVRKRIAEMQISGQPISFIEEKLLRLDGTSFDVELAAVPYSFKDTQYIQVVARDITERKEAAAQLLASEQLFRALVENSPDFIARYDREFRRIYVNPAIQKLFGVPAQNVLGKTPSDQSPVYAPQIYIDHLRQVIDTATETAMEMPFRTAEGEMHWGHMRFVPEFGSDGKVDSVLAIGRDIHEIKENERRFRMLAENFPDLVMRFDRDGQYVYVNPAFEKVFGMPVETVIGKTLHELPQRIMGEENSESLAMIRHAFDEGTADETEVRWDTEMGERIFENRYIPEKDAAGDVVTVLCIARDLTERKRAEDELQQNREATLQFSKQLAALQEITNELSMAESSDNLCRQAVELGRTHMGFDRVGIWFIEEHLGIMRGSFGTDEHGGLRDERNAQVEFRHEGLAWRLFSHKDQMALVEHRPLYDHLGREVGVGDNAMAALWDGDKVIGVISVDNLFTDRPISEHQLEVLRLYATTLGHLITRKRAEEALRASENRFRVLSENAFVGIYIIQDGRLSYVNSTLAKIFGYSPEELTGASPALVIHPDDQAMVAENIRRRITGEVETVHYEFRGLCKDGEIKNIEVLGGRVDLGEQPAIIGNLMDITERKKAENALRESELRYREIFDNVLDGLYLIKATEDGRFPVMEVNPAVERISGIPCSSFPGKTPEEILPAEIAATVNNILRQCMETGLPMEAEAELDLPIGRRNIHSTLIPTPDSTGSIRRIIGISRDVTERRRHELERESIIKVSTTLRQATTKVDILNVILDQLTDLFRADGAVLVLPNPNTKGFVDEMGRGPVSERVLGLNIPSGVGVCNWVINNKKPYLSNHADQDSLFYRPDLLGNSHCLAAVPLLAQEQVIGALWIARQMDVTEQDLSLLNAIADIAANAIHRVTLHEQTEQQLRHIMALHQIDIAISANFDLNVTLNVILKNVKDELDVDATSILLLSSVTHTLNYASGIGFRTHHIEDSQVKFGEGYAGLAAQTYRTVFCPDFSQVPEKINQFPLLAAEEFLSHYATPLIVKGQVKGILEVFHRKAFNADPEWIDYFETLATQAAIAIENASLFENLQRSNLELMLAYDATIEGWSRALDLRDKETEGHTQRVTEMALALADKLGMSDAEKTDLRRGALLHDIGKMGVPDAILLKPGPLSESEWETMRQHPNYALQMLSPISYLKRALDIPYCHHEKWNGSGYPRGLKGETIPLSARLFAIIDVFDALTSDRPYRPAWPHEMVYRYIREQSGLSFDPQIVQIFLNNIE